MPDADFLCNVIQKSYSIDIQLDKFHECNT